MSTLCIIQARMGSSRLPGKVMLPLAGREVIWHVYNRVKQCCHIDCIVVAISDEPQDDVLAEFCRSHDWLVFRGSETDVLSRFVRAAELFPTTSVVRVTCDCPLIDPGIVSTLIQLFENKHCDYASTNYPKRTFPVGTDCEIISFDVLKSVGKLATTPYDREHVMPYVYNRVNDYVVRGLENSTDQSDVRITLDTAEDYAVLSTLYDALFREGSIIDLKEALALYETVVTGVLPN